MPKLLWTIACQRAIVDRQNGNVSLIDILENVNLPAPPPAIAEKKPMVPFRFFVVLQWERGADEIPEQFDVRIRLFPSEGKHYGEARVPVRLEQRRVQVLTEANGFRFTGSGLYRIVVDTMVGDKWRKVGETSFQVVLQPVAEKPH